MKKILIGLGAIAVAAIAGYVWLDSTRDQSTTVDRDEATKLASEDATPAEIEPGARPQAGTFSYTGSGSDDFDRLGGSSHEFAPQIFTVVTLDPDNDCAWTWFVPFVEEHTEARDMCTDDAGISNAAFDRTTEFVGRRQTSSYTCSDGALRLPADPVTKTWTWTCEEARGGLVKYTGTLVGQETLEVGGEQVATRHVKIVGKQRDGATGDETTELWMLDNGLPARFTTTRAAAVDSPFGVMNTAEEWDYLLDSLEPSTEDQEQ